MKSHLLLTFKVNLILLFICDDTLIDSGILYHATLTLYVFEQQKNQGQILSLLVAAAIVNLLLLHVVYCSL